MVFSRLWKVCFVSFVISIFFVGTNACSNGGEEPTVQDAAEMVNKEEKAKEIVVVPDEKPMPDEKTTPEPPPKKDEKPIPKYPTDGYPATVVHVIDGDTLYVVMKIGGWASSSRLLGINAPECVKTAPSSKAFKYCAADDEYYGMNSYKKLKEYTSGTHRKVTINCKTENGACETDPFGRYLIYLKRPDGKDVAEHMLRTGNAFVFTSFTHSRMAAYCRAEADAIRNREGMWKDGRAAVKSKMSNTLKSWYYNRKYSKSHDGICSKVMGEDFAKRAGEK